jgi:hypothetical protein
MRESQRCGNARQRNPTFAFGEGFVAGRRGSGMIYDLPFLSEQAMRNILGGNALRVFGLEHTADIQRRAASAPAAAR